MRGTQLWHLGPMKAAGITLLAVFVAACGGSGKAQPADADPHGDGAPTTDAAIANGDATMRTVDLLTKLNQLPGVTATESQPSQASDTNRYYSLEFTQPVDHSNPTGQTFQQYATLIERDPMAPMIAHTTGYWDYQGFQPTELSDLLGANQISIEYRFFGTSRPDPADWTKLTIEQAATDEHAIITLLKPLFKGAWIDTGESKGGMTASYHRRFFPDDVVGTVPYVAPMSFGAPDNRYISFLDDTGTPTCHQAVRDIAVEMLANRRAMLLSRATAEATTNGYQYTRIAIGPAVESAVEGLEWTFWQYYGVGECADVPPVNATDDTVWAFLQNIDPVSGSDDDQVAPFEAYDYQASFQLGYPADDVPYLTQYLQYTDADYDGSMPIGVAVPTYDLSAMTDVSNWVATEGAHLLFVYGQFDPWTGGKYSLGGATDANEFFVASGTHGSQLNQLGSSDKAAAYAQLAAWTGVTPDENRARSHRELRATPHVPPVMLHGHHRL